MMIRATVFPLTVVLLLFSCTQPPLPVTEITRAPLYEQIQFQKRPDKIRGGGDLSIAVQGERYSGSADMEWRKTGFFRADFYSPFGGVVGSVTADSTGGTVTIQDKQYQFLRNQKMDALPFVWGNYLTFGEFIHLLTGQIPPSAAVMKQKPDSVIAEGRRALAIWQTDTFQVRAALNRRSLQIEQIQFQASGWFMLFRSIQEKLARSIEFREDDRNYFSIRYETLKMEWD